MLKSFTGSDSFGHSVTVTAGSSVIEPGITPANDVVLSWPTFTAAAHEAGISRRYGGIHFEQAAPAGRELGRRVGAQVCVWRCATSANRHPTHLRQGQCPPPGVTRCRAHADR